jgi:hypothetical protein
VPDGVPPRFPTSQMAATGGTSTMLVYAPGSIGLVRRRDITIEVDRSVKIIKVPTADPTAPPARAAAKAKS